MRDPDLMQRAERAAAALEEAWTNWHLRHGLGAGTLPPVSSYVGYSLEEPWGQPRVVLGVAADQAERLAAILDGDECIEHAHAEVASRSETLKQADGPSAIAGWNGSPGIPHQLRSPASAQSAMAKSFAAAPVATQYLPSAPARPAAQPAAVPAQRAVPVQRAAPVRGDTVAADLAADLPADQVMAEQIAAEQIAAEQVAMRRVAKQQVAKQPVATEQVAAGAELAGHDGSSELTTDAAFVAGQNGQPIDYQLEAQAPLEPLPPMLSSLPPAAAMADLPAELPADQAAQLREMAARPSAEPSDPPVSWVIAAAPVLPVSSQRSARGKSAQTAKRPGRQRGVADVGDPDPDEDDPSAPLRAAAKPTADQRTKARMLAVSKLNRARRPSSAAAEGETWKAVADQQSAPDRAI